MLPISSSNQSPRAASPIAPYRPLPAWSYCAGLALFMLLNFGDKVVIGLTAVPMMNELGLSALDFGMVAASFFWLFPLSGIFGGFLANRFKVHWLLVIMALGWTLAQLPIIFGSTLAMVILSRVVLGFFEGPAWGISIHGLYKWFPDEKRIMPVTVMNLGVSVAYLLTGLSMPWVNAQFGWRMNFVILAWLTFAWALLWLLFGREGQLNTRHADTPDAIAADKVTRIPYLKLLTNRTMLSLVSMQFMAYFTATLLFSWAPAFLENGLGYSATHAGALFSLIVLITVPLGLGLPWISQRLTGRGLPSYKARGYFMAIFLLASGMAFAGIGLLADALHMLAVILLALGWAFSGVIFSVSPAVISEIAPVRQRGALLTIYQGIATLSGMISPMFMGAFVQYADAAAGAAQGYRYGFAALGVLLMACGGAAMAGFRPKA